MACMKGFNNVYFSVPEYVFMTDWVVEGLPRQEGLVAWWVCVVLGELVQIAENVQS